MGEDLHGFQTTNCWKFWARLFKKPAMQLNFEVAPVKLKNNFMNTDSRRFHMLNKPQLLVMLLVDFCKF